MAKEFHRTEIKWIVYEKERWIWGLRATWNYYRNKVWRIFEEVECLRCWYLHYVDRCKLRTKRAWCRKCAQVKHWMYTARFYNIFRDMKGRCNDSNNKQYKNYWWRWIKVERESFEDFRDDMYESYLEHCRGYWEKDTTIDRIDVDWNYRKENCRRATMKEQANNKKNSVWLVKFSEESWISMNRILYWHYSKWLSFEQIREKFS